MDKRVLSDIERWHDPHFIAEAMIRITEEGPTTARAPNRWPAAILFFGGDLVSPTGKAFDLPESHSKAAGLPDDPIFISASSELAVESRCWLIRQLVFSLPAIPR